MNTSNISSTKQKDAILLEKRAAQVQGGTARAAVLGVNDGLVSTVCLVLGVAAATGGDRHAVMVAGFAGLVAGAFSMAAGEWVSVRAQVELFQGILGDLAQFVRRDVTLLRDTLEAKFVRDGLSPTIAQAAAKDVAQRDHHFTEFYARQVLGVNTDELGSPWTAAGSSWLLFTAGSLVALLPWFFGGGTVAVICSLVATSLASLIVGAYIAKSSGRSLAHGAIRQFLVVVLASAVTYGIGYLFGVAVL